MLGPDSNARQIHLRYQNKMIGDRQKIIYQKQLSLDNRLNKTAQKARREAQEQGIHDEESFVQERVHEYHKLEAVRRAVKDVKERGK